jgi:N-acetyl sugar amidotransferase
MRRCTKCIMPETKPGISFNELGVCNACVNEESKSNIDYDSRIKELKEIVAKTKKRYFEYDCVIPVSGGKDSTFQAVTMAEKLNVKPLLVCVEPVYVTERGRINLNNLSKLVFDIFSFKPNQKIMPHLLKRSFYEDGQPVRAFEFMLYSVPMQLAIKYRIPLVVWGENPQFEYGNLGEDLGGSAAQQKSCCALDNNDADYWQDEDVLAKDLISFQHPTKDEIVRGGVTSIYMGYYVNYNAREIAQFAIERGLTERPESELLGSGGYWNFEQLDDEIPVISHLLKYYKFGYGRGTDQACRDIRWGYMTREEGLTRAKKYDGQCNPEYIKRYSDYIGVSVKEFHRVANSFRNLKIWKETNNEWRLLGE